ncbi:glyoxylate/hydroxypyruvate reductase A [Bosea sp. (in: a-proteobacteria)]|uniref:2-hydroxyacid dehydrogenase n=1 Tax=Bosea sp. (in: a-proteobacteria) TaxID=1871050 RepID=UPI002631408B|nr:glyoxylate/hydroxypyruvate reductase A [Bosea sp. (in: a-proteobacteria)]MCO5089777.1 glyoxylate/hydroxypyruvate reductase A [Bosea sp. (in: a-proteobacteria)]
MALLFKGLPDNIDVWRRELTALIPDLDMRVWPDVGDPAEIDVAFMFRPPHGEFLKYPNLRAILNLGVGVDPLLTDPDLPRHLPIARIVDPSLTSEMASYLVHSVLHYHRRFDHFRELQQQKRWEYERPRGNASCRVGIMGLGVLGGGAAATLRDLGFTVAGWSKSPKTIEAVQSFHGRDGLDAFLSRTDVLCCILPSTPETKGLLNAALFSRLPKGARFINIARGALVVEADLLAALDSGHLAGATLDVFATEPLPVESRFWDHPKVIVTPHVAGSTTPATSAPIVAENILRARAGKPLINQIDVDAGY